MRTTNRVALAVAAPGVNKQLLNDVLGPRGFVPVVVLGSVADLAKAIRTQSPDLVFVPVPPSGASADFSLVEAELRRQPDAMAIGVAESKDADTVLAAMRAGILEFLVAPLDPTELIGAVQRLMAAVASSSQLGRVVAVYSAKGGLGNSSLAAALAWALAQRLATSDISLVDFTTTGAGLRILLDMNPAYDVGSIVSRTGELDREFLRSCMAQHAQGINVLAASEDLESVDVLSSNGAGRVLELLRQEFKYSIVDTDHTFSDQSLAALDVADQVVLVTHGDVASVRSTQRSLALFARLGYPTDKVLVVLNRRAETDRISRKDVARVIGRPVDAVIPDDRTLFLDAVTYGEFPQQRSPSHAVAIAVDALAAVITDASRRDGGESEDSAPSGGRSRLARLFGRGA
jgi:pilus assembly protein CpaE